MTHNQREREFKRFMTQIERGYVVKSHFSKVHKVELSELDIEKLHTKRIKMLPLLARPLYVSKPPINNVNLIEGCGPAVKTIDGYAPMFEY